MGGSPLARERLTLAFVIRMRWALIAGETVVVLAAMAGRLAAPYAACFVLIAVAATFNLALGLGGQGRRPAREWELMLQLAFNVLQMSALVFLTGGVVNPYCLMLIGPVSLAAATLSTRYALVLGGLTVTAVIALALWGEPLPWSDANGPHPALVYRLIMAAALLSGLTTVGGYAWRAAAEAARMELALSVTQTVLAREQRLSALGGLAAAAAHELGTPLATISVVAKEMVHAAPEGQIREDAELLVSQAERCREILTRLTEEPETDDAVHARMTLLQFANEAIEPHLDTPIRVEAVVTGPPGMRPPEIRRMPEVLHAMTSLVENAVDFARSEVLVSVRFDQAGVSVEVRDDGPGFSSEILGRLGQPYVTSRPSGEGSRSGHVGMGLGFFIAKTLLERTGAVMEFHNGRRGGAVIAARWLRADIEAPDLPDGFELGGFGSDDDDALQ
ncbi:MAG: ActS/PrrB/RegB family redox-sensitive histidine kinase [Caulobacteraceae bacterium]|nr:ActS/PrrB/RegB family redox-sensitive histidine kinase [Caulobacteraceae bacterium]